LTGVSVVMVHGSGKNPAMLLTAACSPTIGWTTSTPSSTSPPASGGMSGSNVHVVLFFSSVFYADYDRFLICLVLPVHIALRVTHPHIVREEP
jgi:hypothetical protein